MPLRRLRALQGVCAPTLALLTALGFILFASSLFGGKVLSPSSSVQFLSPFAAERPAELTRVPNIGLNDATTLFENHLVEARGQLRDGRLPLWDPQIGAGRPLGAEQGAPLFPTSWLAYVLPFWHALAWIALAKLLLAGLGMALFCSSIGLGRPAALLAAVAFAFSNLYVAYLAHGQTDTFGLAPWALFAAEQLVAGGGWRPAVGLGITLGLSLYAGHPETFLLMALVTYAYLAFRLIAERRSGHSSHKSLRSALLATASGILGCIIGAFALVELLDVASQGVQLSRLTADHATLRNLVLGATLPDFWGRTDRIVFSSSGTAGFSSFWNGHVYLGVIPLLLIGVGFVRRPDPRQLFFAAVAVVSVAVLLGGPATSVLHHIPGPSLVSTVQYLWPLALAASIMAAYGAQRVLDGDGVFASRGLVMCGLIALAVVVESIRVRSGLLGHIGSGLRDVVTLRSGENSADAAAAGCLVRFLLIAAAAIGLLWASQRKPRRWLVAVALVSLTALDLVLVDHGWWPAVPQRDVAPQATATLDTVVRSGPQWRVAGLANAFRPDLAERFGAQDARTEDLPELKRYTRLFVALGGSALPQYGETAVASLGAPQLKLLDMLATRWIFGYATPAPLPADLRVVSSRPGDVLLENTQAFPRAWIAYGNRAALGLSDALHTIVASPAQSLRNAPVIEGAASRSPARPASSVVFTSTSDTRVSLDADPARAGWLVLADTFFPGWSATVDGRTVPIHAANGAFRAVAIPAGPHRVVFRYDPATEADAAWLSGLALLLSVFGLAIGMRRGRRKGRPHEDVVPTTPSGAPTPTE